MTLPGSFNGNSTIRSMLPSGRNRTSFPPSQIALQIWPSLSTVAPSGIPPRSSVLAKTLRFLTVPVFQS